MSILNLPQTGRAGLRAMTILQVLTRHGFGHFADRISPRKLIPHDSSGTTLPNEPEVEALASIGRRLVRVCEELGPTFIKLGQTAASRPDLVPAAIVRELSRLQSHVEPYPYEQVCRIITDDLGRPPEELFTNLETTPLASGSIAQVHAAELADGRRVVVKVKRPGIDAIVRLDMHVLQWLSEMAEAYVPELRVYRPTTIVDEFAHTMERELDFLYEGSATQRFAEAFRESEEVHIPTVEWDRTNTNVLTMERLMGRPMEKVLAGENEGISRPALARNIAECFLRQYFETGLFHADPHPGNILVVAPDHLELLDFGMVGQVPDELRGQLVVALMATIQREVDVVIDVLADLGSIGTETDRTLLCRDLRELLEKYYGQPLKRLDLRTIFFEITDLMRRHDVTLPRDFVMLGKSLVAIAGVALQLDPSLNLLELIKPRIRKMMSDRFSSRRVMRTVLLGSWHMATVLGELPRQLRDGMRRLGRGQMQINIQHKNLDHLASEIDRSSNRMAFSILIAATIIGSSMLVRSAPDEAVFGISLRVFGFLGFASAFLMGLGLMIAILRSGKLS